MILLWLIVFIVVTLVSFFLAYRSMKDFKELPSKRHDYRLFLIRNTSVLTQDFFEKMYVFCQPSQMLVSFERLTKGSDVAYAVFAPQAFVNHFPELGLLEIEDYVVAPKKSKKKDQIVVSNKVSVDRSYAWSFKKKKNNAALLMESGLFSQVRLDPDQYFFWQIVLIPHKAPKNDFQVTIRGVVSEAVPAQRIELAKKIERDIAEKTGLTKHSTPKESAEIFTEYARRSGIPKEVFKFSLKAEQVKYLIIG